MKLNINNRVKVRFTETGWHLWLEHLVKINQLVTSTRDYGYFIFPLWELMSIFGPDICLGMGETPFINNELVLVENLYD